MPKKPSAETELRTVKRELRETRAVLAKATRERDVYRARLTRAEQKVSEWVKRFDSLLERTPKVDVKGDSDLC